LRDGHEMEDELELDDVDTPVLFMDLEQVSSAYLAMAAALPGVCLHYAVKCNSFRPVLSTLFDLGSHFEIASATELDELIRIGVSPKDVVFSNPVKPFRHVARAFAAGVWRFAFDSHDEVTKLALAAPGSAVIVRLATPAGRSDVQSEGKFGVDAATATELLLVAREVGLRPYGITFHVGSQMMSPRAWRAPLATVGAVLRRLEEHGVRLEAVDIGGGFPASYGARPPRVSEYAAVIREGLAELPYPVRVMAEPGRSLVAEAGRLVTTVIGTATRGGKRWIHCDVGAFNGLMECLETGNRLRYPVTDSLRAPDKQLCQLTGPTCDSQDSILFDVQVSAGLGTGDRVYLGSAGAYTTVFASTFNGFDVPTIMCEGHVTRGTRKVRS
jgi:ornithine decarboxylase